MNMNLYYEKAGIYDYSLIKSQPRTNGNCCDALTRIAGCQVIFTNVLRSTVMHDSNSEIRHFLAGRWRWNKHKRTRYKIFTSSLLLANNRALISY